jgi:hypothetical protein
VEKLQFNFDSLHPEVAISTNILEAESDVSELPIPEFANGQELEIIPTTYYKLLPLHPS